MGGARASKASQPRAPNFAEQSVSGDSVSARTSSNLRPFESAVSGGIVLTTTAG
jgi:hypothetical protein